MIGVHRTTGDHLSNVQAVLQLFVFLLPVLFVPSVPWVHALQPNSPGKLNISSQPLINYES